MSRRAPISAADALKAVHALAPDAEATVAILSLLSVERVMPQRPTVPGGVHSPRVSADVVAPPNVAPVAAPTSVGGTAERRAAAITRGAGRPTLATLRPTTSAEGPPAWLATVHPFAEFGDGSAIPVASIFPTGRARSIVAASVATRSADGPVAMRALIDALCRLEPVRALPRLPVATVRRGVQLLVDRSAAMDPFASDVADAVRVVEQVVGLPRTQLLRFTRSPLRSVTTRARLAEPWRAPPRGTPVFIVSELGIGGDAMDGTRASRAEWLELARRARAAGCPVVALVPFGPERWDAELARAITHIHWDHRMTAGAVRRAIGPGHATP